MVLKKLKQDAEQTLGPINKAVVTVPIGHNLTLDGALPEICAGADKVISVRRISQANEWEQTDLNTALECRYGDPFHNANAVVLIVIRAPNA